MTGETAGQTGRPSSRRGAREKRVYRSTEIMDRRSFLQCVGKGFLVVAAWGISPATVWGKNALDYALEGQDLIQSGRFDEAIGALRQAVMLDPRSEWAFGLLGRAYGGAGKTAEAIDAFRHALRLNPGDSYSRMMIEMLSQKPVPRLARTKRLPTSLDEAAREEELRMGRAVTADQDLSYRVSRVVIDPGHGGFDSGAVGRSGLQEKEINLDLARRLHEKLTRTGKIQPFLTRTDDYYVPLSDRTAIANQYRADLFISIHINAHKNAAASGAETYFCSERASNGEAERVAAFENAVLKYDEPAEKGKGHIDIEEILFRFEQRLNWEESGSFARLFQDKISLNLPFKSRGVNSANFFVLRRARMPAILLETGFISNSGNEALLRQEAFRERIAEAIASAIPGGGR